MEPLLALVYSELERRKEVRTQIEFASALGFTKSYISQLLKQTTKLPESVREKLHEKYNISTLWLTTGEGDMFLDSKQEKEIEKTPEIGTDIVQEIVHQNNDQAMINKALDVIMFQAKQVTELIAATVLLANTVAKQANERERVYRPKQVAD